MLQLDNAPRWKFTLIVLVLVFKWFLLLLQSIVLYFVIVMHHFNHESMHFILM